ncbi:DUF4168 domain-containing protein [Thioalkalivibrio halophilus]|uniref:DUF4168 domain-containing protein n=1 Tax=Thioalkalivibrio halophilus TaxID=252474 RepID=A0A1V2ZYQ3_9GAMM|nr:DUF4168 domain-containing protein [Thioalkalivibrio halophilus]OOC10248.1 hypothetical protein B1A74_06890 [Thioalkalivibrio halophilus]
MNFRKTAMAFALTSMFAFGGVASAQMGGGAEGGAPPEGGAQGGAPPQGGAGAQGGAPPEGGGAPMQQQAPEVDLSDEDIDTFVEAFVGVQEVREDFSQRLQEAEDETQAQQMQQEAQDEMVAAVEDAGMTVEEYNEVAMALQNDPELMQEVQQQAESAM